MKLSILIPSLPRRRKNKDFLYNLLDKLEEQIIKYDNIEILVFYENKKRSLGEKRDDLVKLANGEYIVFIDDDDDVSDDYISSIMNCLSENPDTDCVVFDSITTIDGGKPIQCKYGIEYEYNNNVSGNGYWTGKPAHTMVYRREMVLDSTFGTKTNGEDMFWVAQNHPKIKKQSRIDKVLYYYRFNNDTTETNVYSKNYKK